MIAARCRWLATVMLCLLSTAVAWGQPPQGGEKPQPKPPVFPDTVVVERDVEYGRAGDVSLKLDIVRPKQPSAKPLPVIAEIHGGAWSGGSKESVLGGVIAYAASGNYFSVSIEYRLSGVAKWPAQTYDCKAAIRWLKVHAKKYNIDPEKIGVTGQSAGGHLVAMLGVSANVPELEGDCGSPGVSSRVACVVDGAGPSDFMAIVRMKENKNLPASLRLGVWTAARRLLGGPIEEKQEAARSASPVTYASKAAAPFLIVHGTADTTVPPEQADLLYAALKKAGADVTLIKVLGGPHSYNGGPRLKERVYAFFDRHLRGLDVTISGEPIQAQPLPQQNQAQPPKR